MGRTCIVVLLISRSRVEVYGRVLYTVVQKPGNTNYILSKKQSIFIVATDCFYSSSSASLSFSCTSTSGCIIPVFSPAASINLSNDIISLRQYPSMCRMTV